ncbi:ATP-binding protein [Campylobacter geochelonis]|uniref:histidine kinase n=1 Tax=Campylobacter geochelonis TaxID=1780362 RepID=A0A128EED5_9BACT|nr:ATP-binding protein [Campylobacter geochelonis]QKF72065.1 two-component system sensor histidine kinase [Campylobacter geochelonis]CZE46802.1 PAS/PAC sensor signal transduction histidine kinase [Campylobacter geochelonis]
MIETTKNIIEKLGFRKNINLLLTITFITMISMLLVFIIYITNLKNVIDDIYTQNIAPIVRLERIRDVYNANISYAIDKFETTDNKANIQTIKFSLDEINQEWQIYLNLPKIDVNKLSFLDFINRYFFISSEPFLYNYYKFDLEDDITQKLNVVDKTLKAAQATQVPVIEVMRLKKDLSSINTNVYLLLTHYLKEINNQKNRIDSMYTRSIKLLSLSLIITTVLFFMLVVVLTINSKKINQRLEKSVLEKTKELQELNENLEIKLKKELEISRQKDKTIFVQSRAASLGEMLENVSHQWRQPLGAISMIIQSFETKLNKNKLTPEFVKSQVTEALILSNSMSKTLEDFKNFYSPTREKVEFSVSQVLKDAIRLTRYMLDKASIKLSLEVREDSVINSYKNEIMQTFINIINNAKDAMKSEQEDKFILIEVFKDEEFALVEITDNAGGVDEMIIDKIFDPYFTTKHQSVGTGVGLYMGKNIIEKHVQGQIDVKNVILKKDNVQYKCAKFIIKIPLMEQKV